MALSARTFRHCARLTNSHRLRLLSSTPTTTRLLKPRISFNRAMAHEADAQNVLGGPLECCCKDPVTGFYRDGHCKTGGTDFGVHVVCAQVTKEFLDFTAARGNDLSTPRPPSFPGLKPGNRWCLCASRWQEACDAGVAPPVVLKATHARALDFVSLDVLKKHAIDG